jgi:IS30 family transposase
MKKYERMTEDERNEIVAMLNKGVGVNEIARRLGRNKSTISREIKRNRGRKIIGRIKRRKGRKYDKRKE